jgi:hypothetical protein
MSTVRDLISGSLRLLGAISTGETPTAQEQTDAFNSLNDMLDSWSTEGLMVPTKLRETFSLVPGQQTYTFGSGGNFNSVRPMLIENALIVLTVTPETEIPMKIVNKDEWASITVKSVQSSVPLYLYNDNAFPLTNVNLWTVPSVATSIVLYSWKPLSDFVTVNDTVSLPPGYNRAIRYNLALELSAEYGVSPLPGVAAGALESKANIKRANTKPNYLSTDAELRAKEGAFNWLIGE